jgi:hypothetical protein
MGARRKERAGKKMGFDEAFCSGTINPHYNNQRGEDGLSAGSTGSPVDRKLVSKIVAASKVKGKRKRTAS